MTRTNARIVIAGGGPVGLMLANLLARLGVESTVIERLERDEYIPPPRTNLVNARSMTLMRRLGIADDVRAADPRSAEWIDRLIFATRLNGFELWSFDGPFDTLNVDDDAPELAEWTPEIAVTSPLRALADRNGVDVRYGTEVVGLEQDEDHVRVTVRDLGTGDESTIDGTYLAACDGPASSVRRLLGVRLEGLSNMAQNGSWLIRAPQLREMVAKSIGFGSFYWLINEDCPANIQPIDAEHWQFHLLTVPEGFNDDPETVKALVCATAGATVDMEILSGGRWTLNSVLAPSLQIGRTFLVGDAGHLISPFGGFGMNIGLLDADNLAWKLAATVQGWGGEELLASYTTERHHADRYVMDIMESNAKVLGRELNRPGLEDPGPAGDKARAGIRDEILCEKEQEFDSRYAVLGYRYDGSPVILADGTDPQPNTAPPYVPSARPGCLAPHVWLDGKSMYDRLGAGFTLLQLDPSAEVAGIVEAAEAAGVPLTTVAVQDERLSELYEQPLVLIRPDQHVAWRGAAPANSRHIIDTVRGA
jgi:2-polyprenyl-6-methoxyphenol hydroxylase-like FAD-dependent oxidoreductase